MAHERTETVLSDSPTISIPSQYFSSGHRTVSPKQFDLPLVIPKPDEHRHRTLVLCFDGTGDQFDDDNSNVVNFFSTLKKDDPKLQLVYYQAGIGTYTIPQIARPLAAKFQKMLDSMIGIHLDAHVMGGYEFLMQNYEAGDKICIFGFSRGAYTARALAGMIHKVGLLPRFNHEQVPFAYKMYSRGEKGRKQSRKFKETFSINVDIELLGLWDTVGSVGIIPKRLPLKTHVKYIRHAIALDERRVRFKPDLLEEQPKDQQHPELPSGAMPKAKPEPVHKKFGSESNRDLEWQHPGDGVPDANVEEVWFAGCHRDVGGGAVPNNTRHSLARIPLRWMIRQCFLLNTGISFHREMLKCVGMDPATLYPHVEPRPPAQSAAGALHKRQDSAMTQDSRLSFWTDDFVSEEDEDRQDALALIYDRLSKKQTCYWWFLEVLPHRSRFQQDDDTWNLGRPRHIPRLPDTPTKVHRTVKIRMEAEAEDLKTSVKYEPRSKLSNHVWVD
ncbi:hypothetical protein V5O48_006188 [Marasmius crinis-equi]|uniref:T6SS Phospholipase effector Tle1-like catalytic domain-containing protein n=1 Tax=Marasmius crinis-equi TaxID=585013 RepID=A0ABR3FKL1_9AGAR